MIAIILVVFFGTLLAGIPIGVAVAATSVSCVLMFPNMPISAEYIYRCLCTALDSTTLLAVPMFILSGNLMAKGGISKKLYDFFAYFVGNKTGGMPIAAIITCLFYGAISGSGPATVAAVGAMGYHFGNAISMKEAVSLCPGDLLCMGNVNPATFTFGTPESIYQETQTVMEACCGWPHFVISSGCDIPPIAKWENIDAFYKAAADFYAAR